MVLNISLCKHSARKWSANAVDEYQREDISPFATPESKKADGDG
jgi:hypothetical protein